MRIAFLALLVAVFALPMPVRADSYTYTYTGLAFTSANGAYTTTDSVTGSFTLSAPLADGLNTLTTVSPVSFSFSDGVDTINNTSYFVSDSFEVETDANGSLIGWSIGLYSGAGGFSGSNQIDISSSSGDFAEFDYHEYEYSVPYYYPIYGTCYGIFGYTYECQVGTGEGYNTYYGYENEGVASVNAGSFSDPPVSTTPEPPALALLATGLVGIAFASRRFRHVSNGSN